MSKCIQAKGWFGGLCRWLHARARARRAEKRAASLKRHVLGLMAQRTREREDRARDLSMANSEIAELQAKLLETQSQLQIAESEVESLAHRLDRELEIVKADTAIAVARRSRAEVLRDSSRVKNDDFD